MTVSLRTRRRLWRWLVFVVLGGIAGIFYTVVILPSDRSGAASWLTGARAGMLIAGGASGLELFVIYGAWGAVLRRLPFLQFLGLRVAAHATLITLLLIFNTYIGRMLGERWADYAFEPKQVLASIAFSLLALTIALFVAQAQSLIGGRTLANVVLGRYHRPRHEERLFLLFDVKGSTPLAVRLGDEKFHELRRHARRGISRSTARFRNSALCCIGDRWSRESAVPASARSSIAGRRSTRSRASRRWRRTWARTPSLPTRGRGPACLPASGPRISAAMR
jgi:hypothetical protein